MLWLTSKSRRVIVEPQSERDLTDGIYISFIFCKLFPHHINMYHLSLMIFSVTFLHRTDPGLLLPYLQLFPQWTKLKKHHTTLCITLFQSGRLLCEGKTLSQTCHLFLGPTLFIVSPWEQQAFSWWGKSRRRNKEEIQNVNTHND